jgi:hypothetical protein
VVDLVLPQNDIEEGNSINGAQVMGLPASGGVKDRFPQNNLIVLPCGFTGQSDCIYLLQPRIAVV